MMFAARKLQGLSVIVLLTIAAFFTYSISLPVSSTRSELQRVRAQVTQLRAENRMIEGDIAVLSTADQLEHWNGELFGYAPPGPAQYLRSERALANLDNLEVPSGVQPQAPIMVAVNDAPASAARAADGADAAPDAPAPRAEQAAVTASVVGDMRRTVALASPAVPALRR